MDHRFSQVDVFTDRPYLGNPVAVVHDADGVEDADMQRIANWTNLSETTFVLTPTDPTADYRVRIFTPDRELPFAGHPTIGTCHAWLEAGGQPIAADTIVQECEAGLITLRRDTDRLAFAAPPMVRTGPLTAEERADAVAVLGIDAGAVLAAEWVDNGPGWCVVQVATPAEVLAIEAGPPRGEIEDIGVVAVQPKGTDADIEIRAFFAVNGTMLEDPVTGSLNASVAQWLIASGRIEAPYVAAQGTAIGRAGRVHITTDGEGAVWVGGHAVTCVSGTVTV